jgi:hypothetical protein
MGMRTLALWTIWPGYVRRQPLRHQLLTRKGAGYVKKSLSNLKPDAFASQSVGGGILNRFGGMQ